MSTLSLTRALPLPPERIWTAMTDSEQLAAWFWPARFGTETATDVTPGGRYRICSPVGPMAVTGVYETVSPPHHLVFTWQWDGETTRSRVTIGLDGDGDGTRLTLVHDGLDDDETRDRHVEGWQSCLDRLAGYDVLTRPSGGATA